MMTRAERLLALHQVLTVDEAAPILRDLVAADLPDALPGIDAAIAHAQAASTPEEGLTELGFAMWTLDPKTGGEDLRGPLDDAVQALGTSVGLHGDCSPVTPCLAERPASCPREHGRALRRAAKEAEWSALELRDEGGGPCHYLDGLAVRHNARIVLQACEQRMDADKALYWRPLPAGVGVVYVRRDPGTEIKAELLVDVAGYIFSHPVTDDMRFRWSRPATGGDS